MVKGFQKENADWCVIHDVAEPATDSDFRVCFECNHVYHTAQEIIDEDLAQRKYYQAQPYAVPGDKLDPSPIEKLTFCPLCLHDW